MTIATALLINNSIIAQNENNKALLINGNYSQYSTGATLGYAENLTKRISIKTLVSYEAGEYKNIEFKKYSLNPLFVYNLINVKEKFAINGEIGPDLAIYKINKISSKEYKDLNTASNYNYGAIVGLDFQYNFEKFGVFVNAYEAINNKTVLFSNYFRLGAGFRINID